jgi:outer membrane protein assembly factor BamB
MRILAIATTLLNSDVHITGADDSGFRCSIDDVHTYSMQIEGNSIFLISGSTVIAADLATCDIHWTWDPENQPIAFSAAGEQVFVVDDARGYEHGSSVAALASDTGTFIWSATLQFSASTLYVHDGVVLVQGEKRLAGIDAEGGRVLWSVPFEDPAFGQEFASGLVFVFTIENLYTENEIKTVHAIDVRTGRERWRYAFEPALLSFVVPTGQPIVLFDLQHYVEGGFQDVSYGFDVTTGELLWRVPDRQVTFLGTAGSAAFARQTDADGSTTLHSFDLRSGEQIWSVPAGFLPHALSISDTSIVLFAYEDTSDVGRDKLAISARDRSTGAVLWTKFLSGTLAGFDSLDGFGYFVIRGWIFAMDYSSGETVWSIRKESMPLVPGQVVASQAGIGIANVNANSIYIFEPLT